MKENSNDNVTVMVRVRDVSILSSHNGRSKWHDWSVQQKAITDVNTSTQTEKHSHHQRANSIW